MGLFDRKPAAQLDPRLEALFVGGCDDSETKSALKSLMKHQGDALQALDSLGAEERAYLVACDIFSGLAGRSFLLVTSRFSLQFPYGPRLEHHEVVETSLGQDQAGRTVVVIESHKARFDFRPNDDKRLKHMIVFTVETSDVANLICAAVDRHL